MANPKETSAAGTALTVLGHRWGLAGRPPAVTWRPRLTEGTSSRGHRLTAGLLAEQQGAPWLPQEVPFSSFFLCDVKFPES